MSTQIDHAIAQYRTELEAEADLAKGDLAELEDHMRSLIDELRATGASSELAISEARLRLGDPKLLAREHARVRSPFGAKLSRARAWSAGGLFLLAIVVGWATYMRPFHPFFAIQLVLGSALAIGVLARLTWARAALAGYVAVNLLEFTILAVGYDVWYWISPVDWSLLAMQVGVLAFVMPWRRGEIGLAGYALALICVMYFGSVDALAYGGATSSAALAIAYVAHAATICAGIGIVMRARWAAGAAMISAVGLIASAIVMPAGHPVLAIVIPTILVGAVASVACAAISWRTARTNLGSLRGFVAA